MPDIEVIALRAFPWSADGINIKAAEEKDQFHLPESLFDGLNAAGFVRRATIGDGHVSLATETTAQQPPSAGASTAEAAQPNVEASANGTSTAAPQPPTKTASLTKREETLLDNGKWEKAGFPVRRSIAAKLSAQPVNTSAEANTVIAAEVARRSAAKA